MAETTTNNGDANTYQIILNANDMLWQTQISQAEKVLEVCLPNHDPPPPPIIAEQVDTSNDESAKPKAVVVATNVDQVTPTSTPSLPTKTSATTTGTRRRGKPLPQDADARQNLPAAELAERAAELSAASFRTQLAMWRNALDESPAHYSVAQQLLTELSEEAAELQDISAPPSALRSIGGWFGFGNAEKESPEAKEREEERLRTHAEATLAVADAAGSLAMLHHRKQEWLAAVWQVRKAWKAYSEAERECGELQKKTNGQYGSEPRGGNVTGRAAFGVGLYNYAISALPPTLKWVIELIGFQGDRKIAIDALDRCAVNMNCPVWMFASSVLVGARFFFDDAQDEALEHLTKLLEKYPNSAVLHSTRGRLLRRSGDLDKSTESFTRARDLGSEYTHFALQMGYELAHNHFLSRRYEDAIEGIEQYLESKGDNFKAYGAYKLGICYWQTNRKDQIVPLYRRLPEFVRESMAYDRYALRQSQLFLDSREFTEEQLKLVEASNSLELEDADGCIATLQSIKSLRSACLLPAELEEQLKTQTPDTEDGVAQLETLSLSGDVIAQALHLRGRALAYSDDPDKQLASLRCLHAATQHEASIEHETWVVPFSWVELASLHEKRKETAKAKAALQNARNASGFDWAKQLDMKAKKVAQKLATH